MNVKVFLFSPSPSTNVEGEHVSAFSGDEGVALLLNLSYSYLIWNMKEDKMMKRSTLIFADILFLLGFFFTPWRTPMPGAHNAHHFLGYAFTFLPPDAGKPDSNVLLAEILAGGIIVLWFDAISSLARYAWKKILIIGTSALLALIILFPPLQYWGEGAFIPGEFSNNENFNAGYGFIFGYDGGNVVNADMLMIEIAGLFLLSVLAVKFLEKNYPVLVLVPEPKFAEEQTEEDTIWLSFTPIR
jgi:hypothetical protein